MALTEFSSAINQVASERGISVDSVLESIKIAYASAFRKDAKDRGEDELSEVEEILVELDPETGEAKIFIDDKDVTPAGFGRIAAQTAKQVIMQKIRETEKDVIMEEFKSKIGTILNATIFRIENRLVTVDLGKSHAQGIMPSSEQVQAEAYTINQKLKVLVKDVAESVRGTDIIVSRSDPQLVIELFKQEVPEIASQTVIIEKIAREPGSRTKIAVSSTDDKIDPVGSCVGQKGVRVQAIISELYGEKIDIVPYSGSDEKFIASALSPAKVVEVELNIEDKIATVSVPEDQQSLAIGKEGQNARLANKLTDWKIDIKGVTGIFGDSTSSRETLTDEKVVGIWDQAIQKVRDEEDSAAELEAEVAPDTEDIPLEEDSTQPEVEETTTDNG